MFRFVCKNTGVLFENDILQVGLKSEYKDYFGKKIKLCKLCELNELFEKIVQLLWS